MSVAEDIYNDCSISGGGGAFRLLSNVLDTKGEGVHGRGYPLWGLFLGTKITGVWWVIRYKLTATLAPYMDCKM